MLALFLRRLLQAVIVMPAVAFISFMLFQYVGDPVALAPAVLAIAVGILTGVYSALRRRLIFVVSHLAADPRLRVGNAGGY